MTRITLKSCIAIVATLAVLASSATASNLNKTPVVANAKRQLGTASSSPLQELASRKQLGGNSRELAEEGIPTQAPTRHPKPPPKNKNNEKKKEDGEKSGGGESTRKYSGGGSHSSGGGGSSGGSGGGGSGGSSSGSSSSAGSSSVSTTSGSSSSNKSSGVVSTPSSDTVTVDSALPSSSSSTTQGGSKSFASLLTSALAAGFLVAGFVFVKQREYVDRELDPAHNHRLKGSMKKRMDMFNHIMEMQNSKSSDSGDGKTVRLAAVGQDFESHDDDDDDDSRLGEEVMSGDASVSTSGDASVSSFKSRASKASSWLSTAAKKKLLRQLSKTKSARKKDVENNIGVDVYARAGEDGGASLASMSVV